MIVVTGAFGFIGSCLIHKLCSQTLYNIVAVDVLNDPIKLKNVSGCPFYPIAIDNLFSWLDENHENVKCVVHLGANSDTTEFNRSLLNKVNTDYTKSVWEKCSQYAIPLIYASSAATYGKGVNGYDDDVNLIPELQPLNPYGESKQDFDKWAIQQTETPPAWYGLKFFNVYGPYECHKVRMASVVYHAYNEIKATGKMKP
ncbi:MAG: NAD-dependent epimerase/dehydratase family protein, partial [Bacteroidales bacterium]|nr:NAD-dependent epimerase/dehydratase family protein [Bacteroidales bacterium]